MNSPWYPSLCLLLSILAPTSSALAQSELSPFLGSWDAALDSPGGALRFGITISDAGGTPAAVLHNGPERIKVPHVFISEAGELVLDIRHYDSQVRLKPADSGKSLSGAWQKRRGKSEWVNMSVSASKSSSTPRSKKREFGQFPGKWEVTFSKSNDPAVAIFNKDMASGHIVGTFLTTTGDYRFLDGQIRDNRLELSCFDGAHAFLFHATLADKDQLTGKFWSANTWEESWTARRNDLATLPDAFAQTAVQPDTDLGQYQFPDLEGKPTRLDAPQFLADARLIYVFGSWCPNCHDAGQYFSQLKDWYGDRLSIVGLAFEMTGDLERDGKQVREYLKRHNCDYPVLLAGLSDKKAASQALPFLDRVRSYPTTLFLNRQGEIKAVHTGFSGPATGEAYQKQKQQFESIIDKILAASDGDKHPDGAR